MSFDRWETVPLSRYQSELEYCLAQAAEMLGGPAVPVWLAWGLEQELEGLLVLEARRGVGREPAMMAFDQSKRGHELFVGLERYRWQTEGGTIRVVRVVMPAKAAVEDFWAVPRDQYRRFYRLLRRHVRGDKELPPVMSPEEEKRLWDNTIGFLRSGQAELSRYGVAPKRGVLLLGEPGNGKTMACRWLASECYRKGLRWRTVTAETYDDARSERRLARLFRLGGPGIILFDDFDAALRSRDKFGDTDRHSTFLGELDGMEQKTGLVFLFTSNARLEELDPAMCRPGRIDVVVQFPKPDATLRRRVIETRWHPEAASGIDVDTVVSDTRGSSFAEIEEAKKLLVMRHVDTGRWDWSWVRQALLARQAPDQSRRPIGFRPGGNGKQCRTPGTPCAQGGIV